MHEVTEEELCALILEASENFDVLLYHPRDPRTRKQIKKNGPPLVDFPDRILSFDSKHGRFRQR